MILAAHDRRATVMGARPHGKPKMKIIGRTDIPLTSIGLERLNLIALERDDMRAKQNINLPANDEPVPDLVLRDIRGDGVRLMNEEARGGGRRRWS